MNQVAAAIQSGEHSTLQHIAQDCGYYDQAQFVRDFQRLIGTNPMTFLRNRDPFLKIYLGRIGSPPDRSDSPSRSTGVKQPASAVQY